MARARNIKPGFFRNEELVELPYETRLLFIGLWVAARVLNGEITTARHLRGCYLQDYAGVKHWSAVSVHDRRRWADVLAAIQRAGQAVAA